MKKIKDLWHYFTKAERVLWSGSVVLILCAFFLFDRSDALTLTASLIGVTSLILNAKGHFAGQILMIIFSVLYGIISFACAYYGEMITYLGMTGPMALVALISWLRHPFGGRRAEVTVNRLDLREWVLMGVLTAAVTVIFYFILDAFDTARLPLSTLSVATSFAAVYLTARRSPFFAVAYAANDLVLMALWLLASLENIQYLSVVICFTAFLANDLYGFFSWRRMEKRQQTALGNRSCEE